MTTTAYVLPASSVAPAGAVKFAVVPAPMLAGLVKVCRELAGLPVEPVDQMAAVSEPISVAEILLSVNGISIEFSV